MRSGWECHNRTARVARRALRADGSTDGQKDDLSIELELLVPDAARADAKRDDIAMRKYITALGTLRGVHDSRLKTVHRGCEWQNSMALGANRGLCRQIAKSTWDVCGKICLLSLCRGQPPSACFAARSGPCAGPLTVP